MSKITALLMFLALAVWLTACSSGRSAIQAPRDSRATLILEIMGRDATIGTLVWTRPSTNWRYSSHDFTVKNALDEQIILDGGQRPVMDICPCTTSMPVSISA